MKPLSESYLSKRFFTFVDQSNGPLSCWPWKGYLDKDGYGNFSIRRNVFRAHRHAFKLMYGDMINEKPLVCHKCDNPKCVNPLHLFLGTVKDNTEDKIKKNRVPKGEGAVCVKLTEQQVKEIRDLLLTPIQRIHIAERFKISLPTLYQIRARRSWKHI